jgi:hypothetical protein
MLPLLDADTLVLSDAWIVDGGLKKEGRLGTMIPFRRGYFWNLYQCTTPGCLCAFSKKIRDYILPFPPSVIIHDLWLFLLVELKFRVAYIPEPLLLFRRHGENLSNLKQSFNSLFFMLKYRLKFFKDTQLRFWTRKV